MTECPACESFQQRPSSGVYEAKCLDCCARLVLSAHPNKRQASVMLAAIERFPMAPPRAQVIERLRQLLAARG